MARSRWGSQRPSPDNAKIGAGGSGGCIGDWFTPAEQLHVDLGELFELLPVGGVTGRALSDGLLLGGALEQGLHNVAGAQVGHQVVKGSMLLTFCTDAVGLSTRGEAFDKGGTEQVSRDFELAQQCQLTLAQSQRGSAAEMVNLSHV